MKIIVASKNPVKINAVLTGFKKMFPAEVFEVEGISAVSGVDKQPKTNQETLNGALNRVNVVKETAPSADFWVGIEGGTEENNIGEMSAFAWIAIMTKDGKIGKGTTGAFFLPKKMVELIKQGKELGEADDIIFGQTNSKQKNGTVGNLTDNAIDRTKYYIDAVILALIPFKNENLYK